MGYNKYKKICRAKTNNSSYFCCKEHQALNMDLIEDGCFMCCEKIESRSELLLFHCNHLLHKKCYEEWLKYSTYDEKICILCRQEISRENKNINQIKNKKKVKYNDNIPQNINELYNSWNKILLNQKIEDLLQINMIIPQYNSQFNNYVNEINDDFSDTSW